MHCHICELILRFGYEWNKRFGNHFERIPQYRRLLAFHEADLWWYCGGCSGSSDEYGGALQKRRAQLSLIQKAFLGEDRNVLMACRIADISGYWIWMQMNDWRMISSSMSNGQTWMIWVSIWYRPDAGILSVIVLRRMLVNTRIMWSDCSEKTGHRLYP